MPTAHFPLLRDPKGLANTVGAAHTRVRHVAGCREKPPAPLPQSVGSPPTCKGQAATRFFASLDRFQLRPLRLVCYPHGDGEGSRATKSCILPLTPWNRPNTHRRGRWIGFATCPCGLASEWGLGQSPRLVFVFEVVLKDTESVLFCVKKTQKTTKNTLIYRYRREQ